jgi:ribosomal protein S27AE
MSGEEREDRRRKRRCPSCGGTSMIRGCRVPGVQLQIVKDDGERLSGLIALYSDVCVECGLTSFYARRGEVAEQMQQLRGEEEDGQSE